jgi:cobalamin biosynthesis protein CobW
VQYDRPWRTQEARQGRLVVIAQQGDLDAEAIRLALAG